MLLGNLFNFVYSQLLPISSHLHGVCLLNSPDSHYKPFYQAIVCGQNLTNSLEYGLLRDIGLLHIIVVSGSHLVFITQIMSRSRIPQTKLFIPFILTAFTLVTRMDPPITRALVHLFLASVIKSNKLNLSPTVSLIGSLVFCISMNPPWFYSSSLLLSAGASLGIARGKNIFTQSLLCYIGLLPLLLDFSQLSPSSVIVNSIITPLISFILFPSSLLCFFVPLESVIDCLWEFLFFIIDNVQSFNALSFHWEWPKTDLFSKWFYISFLCLTNLFLDGKKV
ncbi:MAG: ComEC/Rec2 family competence protein [Bdellovibrionales bacterium]|nr:ComEC/Rec2 family competence protein [Bdellovibrionales bacterium]